MRALALLVLTSCTDPTGTAGTDPIGSAQTPPTSDPEAVIAWLADGAYLTWHCEEAPHAPRSPSPHSPNRICSNELLAAHGDGEFPVDAAAVKELYDGNGDISAYAVSRHVAHGGGAAWFWYEGSADHLNAIGLGDSGTPESSCVGCHQSAGASTFGHDFVFTQVR